MLWIVLHKCSLTLQHLREGRGGVKLSYACEGSSSGHEATPTGIRKALLWLPYRMKSGAQAAFHWGSAFQIVLKPEAFMVNRQQVRKSAGGRIFFHARDAYKAVSPGKRTSQVHFTPLKTSL